MITDLNFYKKLIKICEGAKVKPEDVLLIMTLESNLNPQAVNKDGGAMGLVQFMPNILKSVYKYDSKNHKNRKFNELDAIEQLDYVEKHLNNLSRGRGFKSAAQLYIGNFFPVALGNPQIQAMNPSAVIVEKNPTVQKYKAVSIEFEKKAYESNRGLDYDKDGKITYGDIANKMSGASGAKNYKEALKYLNEAKSSPAQESQEPENTISSNDNMESIVENYLKLVANYNYYLVKGSCLSEKLEIARKIAKTDAIILTNYKEVQIKSKQILKNSNLELSKDLNYKIADSIFQARQYRKEILRGMNENIC